MRNLGGMEIALILIAIVLIFGAGKLPQLGRAMGDTIREFKKSMKDAASDDEKAETKSTEKK